MSRERDQYYKILHHQREVTTKGNTIEGRLQKSLTRRQKKLASTKEQLSGSEAQTVTHLDQTPGLEESTTINSSPVWAARAGQAIPGLLEQSSERRKESQEA